MVFSATTCLAASGMAGFFGCSFGSALGWTFSGGLASIFGCIFGSVLLSTLLSILDSFFGVSVFASVTVFGAVESLLLVDFGVSFPWATCDGLLLAVKFSAMSCSIWGRNARAAPAAIASNTANAASFTSRPLLRDRRGPESLFISENISVAALATAAAVILRVTGAGVPRPPVPLRLNGCNASSRSAGV